MATKFRMATRANHRGRHCIERMLDVAKSNWLEQRTKQAGTHENGFAFGTAIVYYIIEKYVYACFCVFIYAIVRHFMRRQPTTYHRVVLDNNGTGHENLIPDRLYNHTAAIGNLCATLWAEAYLKYFTITSGLSIFDTTVSHCFLNSLQFPRHHQNISFSEVYFFHANIYIVLYKKYTLQSHNYVLFEPDDREH